MTRRPFNKPATTHTEQVELLRSRGMTVDNAPEAEFYLRHLNYYRLRAYWLAFEEGDATHRFIPGTHFQQVVDLYQFDRELRLLLLDALERIEVSVRSHWAYELAHRHGSHAHLKPELAFRHEHWLSNLDSLRKEVERSDEAFIRHIKATYAEDLPPVWAVCEVMSLGLLSRWYRNLKPMSTRSAIATAYGVDQKVFESWLRHLTLVRNVCAHHGRLWNREFSLLPAAPKNPHQLAAQFQRGSRGIYNSLLILLHCMDRVSPQHHWRSRLKTLLAEDASRPRTMGFPASWQSQPLW